MRPEENRFPIPTPRLACLRSVWEGLLTGNPMTDFHTWPARERKAHYQEQAGKLREMAVARPAGALRAQLLARVNVGELTINLDASPLGRHGEARGSGTPAIGTRRCAGPGDASLPRSCSWGGFRDPGGEASKVRGRWANPGLCVLHETGEGRSGGRPRDIGAPGG